MPKSVVVCATEDSWAHVIVRLIAAGADLTRVYVPASSTPNGFDLPVSLPRHRRRPEDRGGDAALLIFDPLLRPF